MGMLTPSEIAGEVSAVSGKPCRVEYNDTETRFSVRLDKHDAFVISVPRKCKYVDSTIQAGILHEALHVKYTTLWDNEAAVARLEAQGIPKSLADVLFGCVNAIEDARIEAKAADEYAGAAWILDAGHDAVKDMVFSSAIEDISKGGPEGQLAEAHTFLSLTYAFLSGRAEVYTRRKNSFWGRDAQLDWLELRLKRWWTENGGLNKITGLSPGHASVDQLRDELVALPDTMACIDFIKKYILQKYLSLLPPELVEAGKAMDKLVDALQDAMKACGGKLKETEINGTPVEKAQGVRVEPTADSEFKPYKFDANNTPFKPKGYSRDDEHEGHLENEEYLVAIREKGAVISRRLAQVLETIKRMKEETAFVTRLTKGTFDRRAVVRVVMKDEGLFMRRDTEDINHDVAFSVTVDVSGSMYNAGPEDSDVTNALAGMHGLAMALREIDRPVALGAFSSSSKTFLKMGETYKDKALDEMISWGNGGTNIMAGLRESMAQLATAKEKTKVNIVITDGQVCEEDVDEMVSVARTKDKNLRTYVLLIGDSEEQEKMFAKKFGAGSVYRVEDTTTIVPVIASIAKKILMNQV